LKILLGIADVLFEVGRYLQFYPHILVNLQSEISSPWSVSSQTNDEMICNPIFIATAQNSFSKSMILRRPWGVLGYSETQL
jgi:hypothetical protein